MQRLEFAKKTTSKIQKNEQKVEESAGINMREVRGISLSRNVFRIFGSDTFYCKSESKDIWYFIRYEPYWSWCSCFDNLMRHIKCKHIFAVEYSIRKGTLKDVEKLPKEVKRDNMVPKDWRNDDYDF